jgi:hypothetical protein
MKGWKAAAWRRRTDTAMQWQCGGGQGRSALLVLFALALWARLGVLALLARGLVLLVRLPRLVLLVLAAALLILLGAFRFLRFGHVDLLGKG